MTTVADIINLWPSPADFAVDLGLTSAVHARTMRLRGSIPRWYWPTVVEAAKRRGIKISVFDLQQAHEGKRQFGLVAQPAGVV